jgi:hypothetical protein
MPPIFERPVDFIERYDNCVDDMGVAFAFEPDDAVYFHLHQFCEGVVNRMSFQNSRRIRPSHSLRSWLN